MGTDTTLPSSPPLDIAVPSIARMYDYYLGGKDHYSVDRHACEELLALAPGADLVARTQRHFLHRVVRTLARDFGIRQFIDHGSGLPGYHNVHDTAHAVDPGCRTLYIDHDPVVVSHGRALLEHPGRAGVIHADIRHPHTIRDHPRARSLIDFSQPVAALFVSVLHCVPDTDHPRDVVDAIISRLAPGSFLAISHLVSDDPHMRQQVTDFLQNRTQGRWGQVGQRQDVEGFFTGLEVMPPGIVEISTWHHDSDLAPAPPGPHWWECGGVAHLR